MPRVPRAPWRRPGWSEAVSAWIEAQIGRLGCRLTGPLEPVPGSAVSSILRARTDAGDLYFKQSLRLPALSDEPTLIVALGARYRGRVPAAVGVDRRRCWMLLEDFGRPVGTAASPEVWRDVFSALARLQVDAADHVEELAASGCRKRDLGRWTDRIEPTLEDAASLSALDAGERRRLRRLAPRLEDISGELQRYAVPPSLVHGDLHLANVALYRGEYLFFDWADACVSHPFLDVAYVFAENAKHEAQARDAYVAHWTRYEPIERLSRMWTLAEPLSALHQAITYRETARYLEGPSRDRFLGGVTYFLRQLLGRRGC